MRGCPFCPHCATVVLPTLQMLARRVQALEDGRSVERAEAPTDAVQAQERQMIIDALRVCQGIQSHAALSLGMSARRMHYKIAKYGLGHLCPLRHPVRRL